MTTSVKFAGGANLQGSTATLQTVFLFLILLFYVLPISIAGGSKGGLPIDIVPSDFLSFAIPLVYLFSCAPYPKREPLIPLQLMFVFFTFALACFSVIRDSDILPLFSFFKFSKVILAFFTGYALSYWFGRDLVLRALSNAAASYLFLLSVSQFVYHKDFTPRLGSEFFEFSIYGFPNSPSSYLVFALCLALLQSRSAKMKWSLLMIATVFAVGSLSRSALILVSIALIAFSFDKTTWRQSLVLIMAISAVLFHFFTEISILVDIVEGVMKRFNSAKRVGDLSNGRFEIFRQTLDFISKKPLTGYQFVSYSNFGTHGTPHNQYLEVWFKSGLVGLLWYMAIIAYGSLRVFKSKIFLSNELSLKSIYVMIALVLIGNFVQPNLSYSPTGNLVFLIFGVFSIVPSRKRFRIKA